MFNVMGAREPVRTFQRAAPVLGRDSVTIARARDTLPLNAWLPAGIAYCGATLMDLLTTSVALGLGLKEGNPAAAPFINAYGLGPQILVSLFICGVLCWYASRGGTKLVWILAAIRWLVVVNNVVQLALANH